MLEQFPEVMKKSLNSFMLQQFMEKLLSKRYQAWPGETKIKDPAPPLTTKIEMLHDECFDGGLQRVLQKHKRKHHCN